MTAIVTWFLTSKLGRWVGAVLGFLLFVAAVVIWFKTRDARLIQKGVDLMKGKQREAHLEAIREAKRAADDVGSGSDRDKRLQRKYDRGADQ